MADTVLENAHWRVVVDPAEGVGLRAGSARADSAGAWLPVFPDARETATGLGMASFLMAPYSNRIRSGRFIFRGTRHHLRRAGDHAIHGDVRHRAWRVTELESWGLVAVFVWEEQQEPGPVNWPWPFDMTLTLELDGRVFRHEVTLTNRADEPAPAGFGFHPYYRRSLTRPGEPVRLRAPVRGVFPDSDIRCIPGGPAEPPAPGVDFSEERPLEPENDMDLCAAGWSGAARIAWPESGLALRSEASDVFSHLILFNPPGKPWFAVEPVTHANDGVNLLERGVPDHGVRVLEPGETLAGRVALHAESL
jgi:aldose 1-epimerase